MLERRSLVLLTGVALAFALPAGAVERRAASDFHLRALVEAEPAAGEAAAVAFTAEAVAALERGGEVRLYDAAGQEIPSLVHAAVSRGEIFDRDVTVFNRAFTEDGVQTLSVELLARKPAPVNQFVFDIADPQYNARVRVEASDDGDAWRIVRDGLHLIRHRVETEKIDYVHDTLRIPTTRARFYRFEIRPVLAAPHARAEPDAPAEPPLEVTGVAVREVVQRGSALTLRPSIERTDDPRDEDPRHHYWRIDLGSASLGVDSLDLFIPETEFARSAALFEWDEARGRRTRQLATAVLFRFGDDSQTGLAGFSTNARILALRIDQGDDAPVTVRSAVAKRPRQQLRFLAPADFEPPLALHFEPDTPRAPEYDLARRLAEREITAFRELPLGPLVANPGYAEPAPPHSERVPFLLYALVIPLVVGLGWYVVRTVQRGAADSSTPPE